MQNKKETKKKLTKEMLLNYLVDVLGYGEREAKDMVRWRTPDEMLTSGQIDECVKFNA